MLSIDESNKIFNIFFDWQYRKVILKYNNDFARGGNNKNDLPSTISVKLDRDNFPLWKSLGLPIIRGYKIEGYMIGTNECPEQYITNSHSSKKLNPSFEDWQAYDPQLLGWLKTSMTANIAT